MCVCVCVCACVCVREREREGLLRAGKSYLTGRLSTIDLLVQTSLDQILFILKILFTLFQNKLP